MKHPLNALFTLFTKGISEAVRARVLRAIADPNVTITEKNAWIDLCDGCLLVVAGAAAWEIAPVTFVSDIPSANGESIANDEVIMARICEALGLTRSQVSRGVGNWGILTASHREEFRARIRSYLVQREEENMQECIRASRRVRDNQQADMPPFAEIIAPQPGARMLPYG